MEAEAEVDGSSREVEDGVGVFDFDRDCDLLFVPLFLFSDSFELGLVLPFVGPEEYSEDGSIEPERKMDDAVGWWEEG